MFGPRPAYGFYCRHVRNLMLSRVETRYDKPDARPAVVADDVQDLAFSRCAFASAGAAPVMLKNSTESTGESYRRIQP